MLLPQQKFGIANRFEGMGLTPKLPPQGGEQGFRYDADLFGTDDYHLKIPKCHNSHLVLLMADRFARSDQALGQWAAIAKKCVDYVEGRQYTAEQIARADREGRPHDVYNKLAPLLRLVTGYHRNNRLDTRYLPADDGNSSEAVAEVLTKLRKHHAIQNDEQYVDTEVTLDGLLTGRGFHDTRLNFERNDFGDIVTTAKDPFTLRIDPDADTYDPQHWSYIQEARWCSIDEIEFAFGVNAAQLVWPLIGNSGYRGGHSNSLMEMQEEITPWRTFGGGLETGDIYTMEGFLANSIDPMRKNVRIVDTQWAIRVMQRCIINLETGDREPIPDHFTPAQIQKTMQWCAEQYAVKGQACPLRTEWRPMRRIRWTTIVGDLVVYDDWSPYESYTITPYFPWFRRGKTRGMIEDLIGPQAQINATRNARTDIIQRTAHSGWMWHERSLRESEKIKIEKYGASAGINIEFKGDPNMKPEKIQPGTPPTAMERLEESATEDLKEVAGISDSALGQIDRVQSGRAIEARQRQSILGIETYMDNGRRTKLLLGRKHLEMYQNHLTEARIFKIAVANGKFESVAVNQRAAVGAIINDLTIGKYGTVVDDTPISASFASAQYEEMVEMAEKGLLPIPLIQDIAIDLSSLPQKELLKQRMNALLKAQGLLTADEMVAAMQAGIPIDPASIPQGPQPASASGPAGPAKDQPVGHTGDSKQKSGEAQPMGASPAPAAPGAAPGGGMY